MATARNDKRGKWDVKEDREQSEGRDDDKQEHCRQGEEEWKKENDDKRLGIHTQTQGGKATTTNSNWSQVTTTTTTIKHEHNFAWFHVYCLIINRDRERGR